MTANPHSHLPKPEPYQRLGSGDGEREASMTRQMPYEPLPASVLFALVLVMCIHSLNRLAKGSRDAHGR
jgi:hypothetical protein